MHKNATKCNKTQSKWCINKHGASKIIDTFETYHAPTVANNTIMKCKCTCVVILESQLRQFITCHNVGLVSRDNIMQLGGLYRRNGTERAIRLRVTRESISCRVLWTLSVDNSVLKTQHLGQGFMLPRCMQVCKMRQAALICQDTKFSMLKVWPPLIDHQQDSKYSFS
jgi:hypothetical protein